MRALAVVAVVLFHLDLTLFSGGFLGVDLFFVISGFIISRNIRFDLSSGEFRLRDFYLRRVRRLLPALVVTVLLTLIAGLWLIPPLQLEMTAESALYALFSLANFHFWSETGYFDAAASTKPLLHTWSLSLEEQFYLFWPALMIWLVSGRRLLAACLILLVSSASLALAFMAKEPGGVFYLLPFRVHQLMAGAFLALASYEFRGTRGNSLLLAALLAFLAMSVLLDEHTSTAGAMAASLVGFCLILCRECTLAKVILGSQLLLWIGERSYAIYLVHWPMVVLFKYGQDFDPLNASHRMLLGIATGLFAIALHEWVEKPLRWKRSGSLSSVLALRITGGALAATVIVAAVLVTLNGLPTRLSPEIHQAIGNIDAQKRERQRIIRHGRCNLRDDHALQDYRVEECARPRPGKFNVFIIGDSLAADIYMLLVSQYPDIHFSQATAGGCRALIEQAEVTYPTCETFNRERFTAWIEPEHDLVILASHWRSEHIDALERTVSHLQDKDKKVWVFGPRPAFPEDVPILLAGLTSLADANQEIGARALETDTLLTAMRLRLPGISVIDTRAFQCTEHCEVISGQELLYIDDIHYTPEGADLFGQRLQARFPPLARQTPPEEPAANRHQ